MLRHITIILLVIAFFTGCANRSIVENANEQTDDLFNVHEKTKKETFARDYKTYYDKSFKDLKKIIGNVHDKQIKIGVLPISNDSSNKKMMRHIDALVKKSINKLGEWGLLITTDKLIDKTDILIDGSLFGYDSLVKIMKDKDLDVMVGKGKGETDIGYEKDTSASLVSLKLSLFASNKGNHAYPNTQVEKEILVTKNSIGSGFSINVYGNGIGFGEQIQIGGSTDSAIELLVESALIEVIARKFSLPLHKVDKFQNINEETTEATGYYERKKFINTYREDKQHAIKAIETYLKAYLASNETLKKQINVDGIINSNEEKILNQIIKKENLSEDLIDIYLFLYQNQKPKGKVVIPIPTPNKPIKNLKYCRQMENLIFCDVDFANLVLDNKISKQEVLEHYYSYQIAKDVTINNFAKSNNLKWKTFYCKNCKNRFIQFDENLKMDSDIEHVNPNQDLVYLLLENK